MKFKVSGVYSLILVLVAFSSLVSMFALTRIDSIIRQDLYRYGLRFSYEWATPYWTLSSLVFVMGWANIILACAFQFYVLLYGRKREKVIAQEEASKPEPTQLPVEEKPVEAEEAKVETEIEETIAPPMEVELGMREEEEAQKLAEEPLPPPAEAGLETSEKGEEALQPPEVGEEAAAATVRAEVGTTMETTMAETMQPQETAAPRQLMVCRICGAQNPIGTEFCAYCGISLVPEVQEVEGQREQEAELRETVETETQGTSPSTPDIEEETAERKKRRRRRKTK